MRNVLKRKKKRLLTSGIASGINPFSIKLIDFDCNVCFCFAAPNSSTLLVLCFLLSVDRWRSFRRF